MIQSTFRQRIGALLLLAGAVAGCTAPSPGAEFNDPYEATNRQVHAFNKGLDTAVLRPLGQVVAAAPRGTYQPVVNFSDNLSLPGMVVNGVLQGDIDGAATNSMRFIVNSTIGMFGIHDWASDFGLHEQKTDFGETLAVWGVPEGAYLELPLIGPSTERDAVGEVVDILLDPLDYFGAPDVTTTSRAARAGEIVVERGMFSRTVDSVLYDSADSYAQTRLLYLQNRRFELGEEAGPGQVDPYAVDPYGSTDPYAIDPYQELSE
ncbi:putative lipoprotein [Oceanicola granulosus HTCC2516]|uniref:Putative lipoprotein n=1 Tax=Oceanicola granulosus (strain ATCC BAA-861 / DSM 15982 / KCTC 12143 / HTCC2516) TaxID=314256 RepID=Q2CAK5_OCEGH|nr:VacJ family lipoprotein [Oceanicola granulosus]EAR49708.1 putative lipoprotein [Oceanicola granulosus HTCC2516]